MATAISEIDDYKERLEFLAGGWYKKNEELESWGRHTTELLDRFQTVSNQLSTELGFAVADVNVEPPEATLGELRTCLAEARAAHGRYCIVQEEVDAMRREAEAWMQFTSSESGKILQHELAQTRTSIELLLYAIKLGKTANGKDSRAHIMRYVLRHPDASDEEMCTDLDSHGIAIPTINWQQEVIQKYGTALWMYSWEGDRTHGIPADKKLKHRAGEYLWRYRIMGQDFRTIYKLKQDLTLRGLKLPEIKLSSKTK
jgi:hypothetical protein